MPKNNVEKLSVKLKNDINFYNKTIECKTIEELITFLKLEGFLVRKEDIYDIIDANNIIE